MARFASLARFWLSRQVHEMGSIQVHPLTSIDELSGLGPRYDAMVLSAGDGGLFYQRAWLERVWPHYRARLGATLSFLIAEQDGDFVGLAPLALRTKDWAHARQRVLEFIGGTWDELDNWMPGFLFATRVPGEQADVMRAFAQTMARQRWDLLELRLVRASCPSREVLQAQFRGLRATPESLTTPRARIDSDWTSYWAGRSKRLTRIVERGRKRAAEDGVSIVHEVTSEIPVARRGEVEAIHGARQAQLRASGRARNSPFEDPHAAQVFWSLLDWASSRGSLRMHWLRVADRTAAYVVALHHANTTFAYFNAIDPSAERYHPGSLILASLIEHEVTEHGAVVIDMMAGANLTKALFATEDLVLTNMSVVNPDRPLAQTKHAWIRVARELTQRLRRR